MKNRKLSNVLSIAVVTAIMSTVAGCLWAPGLDGVRREIQDQLPGADFDKEFAISLGPVSLGFARMVTGFIPDADVSEARGYLKDVRKIEVAVYNAHHMPRHVELEFPKRLRDLLENEGWEMAVKVNERDESVWVLYKTRNRSIRELYVVAVERDELVLVRAKGHLDRLFDKVMEEHHDDLVGDLGFSAH